MSKHDLPARPVFHHTRDAIEAHLAMVMAALAVVGHEAVVMGAAGLGLSGWVVLNHPSDRRKPRCHDPP